MSKVVGAKKAGGGRSNPSDAGSDRSSRNSVGSNKSGKLPEGGKKDVDGTKSKQDKKKQQPETKVSCEGTSYAELAKLADTPPGEQGALFIRKAKLCCVIFDMRATEKELAEKEGKRQTLVELMETVSDRKPSIWLEEGVLDATVNMMGINLFRTLWKKERLIMDLADADDEDPSFDPAWPHLELIYEMLSRLVSCKDTEASVVTKVMTGPFIRRLVGLTDSDDPREREILKTIIRRIQDKLSSTRSDLRKALQSQLQLALVDGSVVNGLPEMLEIFARFVHSFSAPLKDDHKQVFRKIVLPLHKVEYLNVFHSQLLDVMKKYCEKDKSLALEIVKSLLRFWPVRISAKQILYLSELDDFIGMLPPAEVGKMNPQLGRVMVECLTCLNSDVADKALALWKGDKWIKLIFGQCRELVPGIISALYDNATQHWQESVNKRTVEVLKLMLEKDPELFDSSSSTHRKACEEREKKDALREKRWATLQAMHDKKMANSLGSPTQDRSPRSPRSGKAPTSGSPSPLRTRGVSTANMTAAFTNTAVKANDSENRQSAAITVPGKSDKLDGDKDGSRRRRTVTPLSTDKGNGASGSPRPQALRGQQLGKDRYGIAISWAKDGDTPFVVGLQAALVDNRGRVIDAACQHNPVCAAGAIALYTTDMLSLANMHKECTGTLWVSLSRLPPSAAALLIVASPHTGKLQELDLCDVHVVEECKSEVFSHFIVEKATGTAAIVALLRKDSQGQWAISKMCEGSKAGRHIVDLVEPVFGKVIREMLPALPKKHKSLFSLSGIDRGGVVFLPTHSMAKFLFVGLSWDLAPPSSSSNSADAAANNNNNNTEELCLCMAILFLDSEGQILGAADAKNSNETMGVKHSGKGITGQGCTMDLSLVPDTVSQIFIVGFVQEGTEVTMDSFQKLNCCFVDPLGTELLRYRLPDSMDFSGEPPAGWLAGRMTRGEDLPSAENHSRWAFQALGLPCSGDTWESSLVDIEEAFREPLCAYQQLPPEIPSALAPTRVVSL